MSTETTLGRPTPSAYPGVPSPTNTTPAPAWRTSRVRRVLRGPDDDAPWIRPALVILLGATAVLYLWGLGASGWANSFYSAAAQAGSESWKAFFFGSFDAANAITVDKPPLSLWVMALSVRAFGLSSWSVLVPEALMGVAAVGLLYATVRRTTGSPGAGLLAGAVLATTPAAALMFRFNNPDAMLVLLLVAAAAATLRAVEATEPRDDGMPRHPVRWLTVAGALVGLAFLTKMLQALLVLPAFGLVYLLAAQLPMARRIRHLLVGIAAMVVSAGWWVAIVALWPASSRPYIGGSQHNSILELTLGYNGLGRITGDEAGSVGGQGGWGKTGLLRLLGTEVGGQIGWLLPTAVLLLAAGLWFGRRAPRTDRVRAGLVLWGGWLVVTAVTFSFMQGIFHPYYTVALAPAVAACVALGGWVVWQQRETYPAGLTLATATAMTSTLAFLVLGRTPDYHPWLRWLVVLVGFSAALLLGGIRHLPRSVGLAVTTTAVVAGLLAPTAYSITTAASPHSGSIPSAGPAGQGAFGGNAVGGPGGGASPGGLLTGSTSSPALTRLLITNASDYAWVAATVGSNSAAGYQLATQHPVMAVGGFNGSDPSPTLAQFEQLVADGKIHYFITGITGMASSPGGASTTSSQIARWVEQNFSARTVDGITVYDLADAS